jgi:hypothetical protein
MGRFFGGVLLLGIWFAASAFLILPVAFLKNGLLLTGALLLVLASVVAGLIAFVKRKDSLGYAFAAAPGFAFAAWVAIEDIVRRL